MRRPHPEIGSSCHREIHASPDGVVALAPRWFEGGSASSRQSGGLMADPPLLPMAFVPAPNRYSETETDNDRLTSSLRLYGAVHALLGCAVGEAGGIAFAASVGLNTVARVACGAIVGLVLSQSFGLAFFRRH